MPRVNIPQGELERLVAIRHELHKNPEISLRESWTAAFVEERLRDYGIDTFAQVGGYGLVGVIEGMGPGPAIALRADMDALAIQEENRFSHASQCPGIMHACGHDGHMTILLGAAAHLCRTRRFRGTIYLAFQPAEEGFGGAQLMLDSDLLGRFPAKSIFGFHNWPGLEAGHVALHDGPVMAGAGEFTISFSAQGGHAAAPHLTGDPVLAGSYFTTGIQQAVARSINPLEPAVVTVAAFQSGSAPNAIPSKALLKGTFRGQSKYAMALLQRRIDAVAVSAATLAGTSVDVEYNPLPSPPVVNSEAETSVMRAAIEREQLPSVQGVPPSMAADDFGTFLQYLPGAYAWIGNGSSALHGSLHQPNYDFNDDIILPAVRFMAATAEIALQ